MPEPKLNKISGKLVSWFFKVHNWLKTLHSCYSNRKLKRMKLDSFEFNVSLYCNVYYAFW